MIVEDLGGAEERVDPEAEVGPTSDRSGERMCHYYRKSGHLLRECQKKKRD